ncbi:putative bifunctional diguanylate cyclase/phosphodiesterase [Lactobacillus porci]|uniref:putative bifunctional diguanylate cyclase/phosphodiesterase n=1 Tax=Lactobacillus porci TaxID=2012477 RepID=UPI00399326A3
MECYEFDPKVRESYESLSIPIAIYQTGPEGRELLLVSDGLCQMLDQSRSQLMQGAIASDLSCLPALLERKRELKAAKSGLIMVEYADLTKQQERLFLTDQAYLASQEDDYFRDQLTGLPNTNYFQSFAQKYLNELQESGQTPIVVFFDIYGMHAYNDHFGYAKGDQLLRTTARIIRAAFPNSLLVRFVEDHFVMVTADHNLLPKLKRVAKDVMDSTHGWSDGVHAGIYYCQEKIANPMTAVDNARKALKYMAGNRQQLCCVYDQKVKDKYDSRDYVLTHFNEALRKGWIQAYFQPEMRAITGRLCGAEALARWVDPEKGVLSPGLFIPVLEEANLIHRLDLCIIEQACQTIRGMKDENEPMIPISVNLSRIDFQVCDIFKEVDRLRRKYDLSPKLLKIEVTESTLTTAPEALRRAMREFQRAGYDVWMDDFGSGYSSLNNLQNYNFDLIKIDMIFLRNFASNPSVRTIVAAIVDMAKRLGIQTLCEGVETMEQADFLREVGCERLQGFLFAQPLPFEEFIEYFSDHADGHLEPVEENEYYREAGQINVLSDPTLGSNTKGEDILPIVEIEEEADGRLNLIYINNNGEELLASSLNMDGQELQARLLDEQSNWQRAARRLIAVCRRSRESHSRDFIINAQPFNLRMMKVAGDGQRTLFVGVITDLSKYDAEPGI